MNPELDYYNEVSFLPPTTTGHIATIKRYYFYIRDGKALVLEQNKLAREQGRAAVKDMLTYLPADMLLHLVQSDPELGLAIAFFKPI